MIVIEGTIRVKDLAVAREAMTAMIEASRAEPGCLEYAYAVDLLDPGLVRVIERWSDRACFDAHLTSSHLRAWRSAWAAIGVYDRRLRFYEAEAQPI